MLQARFNATIWPGIVLDDKAIPSHLKKYEGPKTAKLSKGQLGCALAHITLLEHFLTTKAPAIIVFEDDARPVENFSRLYNDFIDAVPRCEWCQLVHHPRTLRLFKEPKNNEGFVKAYGSFGTVAYTVSRIGALKLLHAATPIWYPIDEMWRCHVMKKTCPNPVEIASFMPTSLLVPCPLYKQKSLVTGMQSV